MGKLFIAILITFVGMVLGYQFIPVEIAFYMPIATLIVLIGCFIYKAFHNEGKLRFSILFVYFIAFLMGIGMYPLIGQYASQLGAYTVMVALGVTTFLFGALSLYALKSKEDFSSMGGFLLVALLALILLSLLGFFIHMPLFHILLSFAGILIFSGFVLYDISQIKQRDFEEEDVPMLVLDLYLDFINIFLYVLRILSIFKN